MATNLLDLIGHMQTQGDIGRERGKRSRLADLASQAYGAPREQQSQFVQQAIQTDPDAGFALGKNLQSGEEARNKRLAQMAHMLTSVPPETRAGLYRQMVPELQGMGMQGLPTDYTPETASVIDSTAEGIVKAFAGSSGSNVQSRFVGDDGQVYALMRDGSVQGLGIKADPKTQIMEAAGGIFGIDKRTFQASPVQVGAPGRGGEVPFSIDPSLPPEIQADIRRSEAQGQPWTQAPQGGQQLQAAPKQLDPIALANLQLAQQRASEPSDFEQRIQMARDMGATPEQLQQMVLGSSGGGKPTATQLRQANVAKTKLIDLRAIRNQLQTVKERFGPLKNTLSAGGIYGVGGNLIPSEDGQRFDAAVDLMRQFVRKMTRTPGEGAMSDWEGRLANLANPSRGDREAVTEDKIAQLEQLIDSLEQGYGAVLQDNGGNMDNVSPPDAPKSNAIPVNNTSDDDLIGKYL